MRMKCPFTGASSECSTVANNPFMTDYSNVVIGRVTMPGTLITIAEGGKYKDISHIITGISRHHWVKYKTPFEITSGLLEGGYKEFNIPSNFKQKSYFLLNYLYENGGSEYKKFVLFPGNEYPLAYSTDSDEFIRILDKLDDDGLVILLDTLEAGSGEVINMSIRLSKDGIAEIEKDLPEFPMFDLAKQKVFTGDERIDELIQHSKNMFFKHDATDEDKRSACEALCKVLEPIREEMKAKKFFGKKDVEAFFEIVNDFDIRHNREYTKQLVHTEQFEWLYYSLLNSIICFYKLNTRLN
jgi:hypothetical protein